MAKCIKKDNQYRRVFNQEAETLVNEQGWEFVCKKEYKEVRDEQLKKQVSKPIAKKKGRKNK